MIDTTTGAAQPYSEDERGQGGGYDTDATPRRPPQARRWRPVAEWVAAAEATQQTEDEAEKVAVAKMSTPQWIAYGLVQLESCTCCGALVGNKMAHVDYHRAQVEQPR